MVPAVRRWSFPSGLIVMKYAIALLVLLTVSTTIYAADADFGNINACNEQEGTCETQHLPDQPIDINDEIVSAFSDLSYSAEHHFSMLNDHRRNRAFFESIERAVRVKGPKAQVLDIGSGTSLQAMIACREMKRLADSKSNTTATTPVVGIERNPNTYAIAREILEKNGMEECVRLQRCKSQEVIVAADCPDDHNSRVRMDGTDVPCIPKQADILVSETLADELLGEGWAKTVDDARDRGLLTPDAIVIPARASVYAQLIWTGCSALESDSVEGFDLSALAGQSPWGYETTVEHLVGMRNMSDVFEAFRFNFGPQDDPTMPEVRHFQVPATGIGRVSGVVVWWEAVLWDGDGNSEDIVLSTGPGRASHWSQVVYVGKVADVVPGTLVDVSIGHDTEQQFVNFAVADDGSKQSWCVVVNDAPFPVKVFWLPSGKEPVLMKTVKMGETSRKMKRRSFKGHQFLLQNKEYGLSHILTVGPILTIALVKSASKVIEMN
jgi:predicted RNA methylase